MPPVMYIEGMYASGMGNKMNSVQSLTREFNLSAPEGPHLQINSLNAPVR